jgi:hypothetical protein
MKSQLVDENKVKEESLRQNEYLNGILGIVIFSLALSCVGLPNPQKAALVLNLIIIPMVIAAIKHVPSTIITLRELRKEHPNDEEVRDLLKYLEKKYLGFHSAMKNNLVYLGGITFYILVLFSSDFTDWFKAV